MFHIEAQTGVFAQDFSVRADEELGFHDHYFPAKEDGFVNHCSIQSGSRRGPIRFASSQGDLWGKELSERMRDGYPRTEQLQAMVETCRSSRTAWSSTRIVRTDGVPLPR